MRIIVNQYILLLKLTCLRWINKSGVFGWVVTDDGVPSMDFVADEAAVSAELNGTFIGNVDTGLDGVGTSDKWSLIVGPCIDVEAWLEAVWWCCCWSVAYVAIGK